MSDARSVTVLTMGGTIDKVYNLAGDLEVGPPAARDIIDVARAGRLVTIETVVAKDSIDLTPGDRELLLRRISRLEDDRVVITHGTDTMTQTADYLHQHRAGIAAKTVVLTGALQPAAMRITDAHFNLGAALLAVQISPPGIHLSMNGRLFAAGTVAKDPSSGTFVSTSD